MHALVRHVRIRTYRRGLGVACSKQKAMREPRKAEQQQCSEVNPKSFCLTFGVHFILLSFFSFIYYYRLFPQLQSKSNLRSNKPLSSSHHNREAINHTISRLQVISMLMHIFGYLATLLWRNSQKLFVNSLDRIVLYS